MLDISSEIETIREALFSGQHSEKKHRAQEAFDRLLKATHEAFERARVVGVLDARDSGWGMAEGPEDGDHVCYAIPGHPGFRGATPAAARAAAAKAIENGEDS